MNTMPSMTQALPEGMSSEKAALRRSAHRAGAKAGEGKWEYRFYFAILFVLFLPVVLASRLLPRAWRPFKSLSRASVLTETRAAANTVVPFIFMA